MTSCARGNLRRALWEGGKRGKCYVTSRNVISLYGEKLHDVIYGQLRKSVYYLHREKPLHASTPFIIARHFFGVVTNPRIICWRVVPYFRPFFSKFVKCNHFGDFDSISKKYIQKTGNHFLQCQDTQKKAWRHTCFNGSWTNEQP